MQIKVYLTVKYINRSQDTQYIINKYNKILVYDPMIVVVFTKTAFEPQIIDKR